MVVVSYDISNDKLRTKFAKYLSRFGHYNIPCLKLTTVKKSLII